MSNYSIYKRAKILQTKWRPTEAQNVKMVQVKPNTVYCKKYHAMQPYGAFFIFQFLRSGPQWPFLDLLHHYPLDPRGWQLSNIGRSHGLELQYRI